MITHIPDLIPLYGIPNLWDMTHYEKGHIRFVKRPYNRTSKRSGNLAQEEIIKKIQNKRIFTETLEVYIYIQFFMDFNLPDIIADISKSRAQKK
jgi:hypothetical protein